MEANDAPRSIVIKCPGKVLRILTDIKSCKRQRLIANKISEPVVAWPIKASFICIISGGRAMSRTGILG